MTTFQPVLYARQGLFQLSSACKKALGYENFEERLSLSWEPNSHGTWNLRCDPALLALYRQKGSAWISDEGVDIRMTLVPSIGYEYIQIHSVFAAEYTHEEVSVEFDAMYQDIVHMFLRDNKDALPLAEDMARFQKHIEFVDEGKEAWMKRYTEVKRLENEWKQERTLRDAMSATVTATVDIQPFDEGQTNEWQIVKAVKGRGRIRRGEPVAQMVVAPVTPLVRNLFTILESEES